MNRGAGLGQLPPAGPRSQSPVGWIVYLETSPKLRRRTSIPRRGNGRSIASLNKFASNTLRKRLNGFFLP